MDAYSMRTKTALSSVLCTKWIYGVRKLECLLWSRGSDYPNTAPPLAKLIHSLLLPIFSQTRAATSMSGQHALAYSGSIDLGLSLVLGLLALRLTINASIIAPPLNSERTESITFTSHPTPVYNPDLAVFGRPKPVFATVAKENPPVLCVVNGALDTAALCFESFFDSNCGSGDPLNRRFYTASSVQGRLN